MKAYLSFIFFILLSFFVKAEQQDAVLLLPEVRQALAIKPIDKSTMDQNIFVGLVSLDLLEQGKSPDIRKQQILERIDNLEKAIKNQDNKLMEEVDNDYYSLNIVFNDFYCYNLGNHNCINQVISDEKNINQLINKNKLLLDAYKKVIKLPNYEGYFINDNYYFNFMRQAIQLSNLHLMEAIYAIHHNKIEEGLSILQEEMAFNKKILISSDIRTPSYVGAKRRLFTIYHVIEGLLDLSVMDTELNNPKLVTLLSPFSEKEQQVLATIFKGLRNNTLMVMYTLPDNFNNNEVIFDYNGALQNEAKKNNIKLTWNKEKTMNAYYKQMEHIIDIGGLVLPKSSDNYLHYWKNKKTIKNYTLKEIVNIYGKDNIVGNNVVINLANDNWDYVFLDFYDLVSYQTLVETKLKIKQAKIIKEQIPNFLKSLQNKAVNPYSQQPFIWNDKEQTLSFDWLESDKDALKKYGKQATIIIKSIN